MSPIKESKYADFWPSSPESRKAISPCYADKNDAINDGNSSCEISPPPKPKKKRRKTGRFGDCSLKAMLEGIPKAQEEEQVNRALGNLFQIGH